MIKIFNIILVLLITSGCVKWTFTYDHDRNNLVFSKPMFDADAAAASFYGTASEEFKKHKDKSKSE